MLARPAPRPPRDPRPRPAAASRGHPRRGRRRRRGLRRARRRGRRLPLRRRRRAGGTERRVPLVERAHGWWFGFVPGMGPGQRYNLRVDGAWDPDTGLRHNAAKLLLDPYARAVEGEVAWGPEVYGHVVDATWHGDGELRLRPRQPGPRAALRRRRRRVRLGGRPPPGRSRSETVIYEAHVRNQTALHPDVPEELRGTYAGLAHPASVPTSPARGHGGRAAAGARLHPRAAPGPPRHDEPLGLQHPRLLRPARRLRRGRRPAGRRRRVQGHGQAAAPRGHRGHPRRRLQPHRRAGPHRRDAVVARPGPAGLLPPRRARPRHRRHRLRQHPRPAPPRRLPDGARLAALLGAGVPRRRLPLRPRRGPRPRRGDEFDPDHPFLVALRTDPVLSRSSSSPSPGTSGCTAGAPASSRRPSWSGTTATATRSAGSGSATSGPRRTGTAATALQDLATRLAGSRDLFGHRDRGPTASVNFVTAHDGFTLADLTAYDHKHNEANGEGNRDGSNGNRSWNHGVEGPTDDPAVLAAAPPHDAQPARHPAAVDRRADAQRRRRVRPHPARQQQPLLPGQRDQLDRSPGPGRPDRPRARQRNTKPRLSRLRASAQETIPARPARPRWPRRGRGSPRTA